MMFTVELNRAALAAIMIFCPNATYSTADENVNKCKLYLAKSTIPNAGLGVFTGIDLSAHDDIGYGDPAIPIVDLDFHNAGSASKEDYHWLLDEYNWKATASGYFMELEAEKTSAHITGFGAMPNCHMRLKNIAESKNEYDTAGISRSNPGIGAFTGYHNRKTRALKTINAGQELFVDYGPAWFLSRESYMGLVPLANDYPVATSFLQQFSSKRSLNNLTSTPGMNAVMTDLWHLIVSFPYKSRPLSALPKCPQAAIKAIEKGIYESELWQSTRSLNDLEREGVCLDNIRYGNSSIPGAGRGAFATKSIPKGGLVAPAPLLHVPDRDILTMYGDKIDPTTGQEYRDFSRPLGHQLLLNYCFGHNASSMLLCPYSHQTAYINHNSKSPNAEILWSASSMYHNKSLFEQPVEYFDNIWNPVLGFDFIALKDIQEGEEITINYGRQWEDTWSEHVRNWKPPKGHEHFTSPQELNEDTTSPLQTHEEDATMYSEHIDLYCMFSSESIDEKRHKWTKDDLGSNDYIVHRIIDREVINEGDKQDYFIYTLDLLVEIEDEPDKMMLYTVENVPREAISFYYKRYHSDMFVNGAFRHEMMIPDDMLPQAWRNVHA